MKLRPIERVRLRQQELVARQNRESLASFLVEQRKSNKIFDAVVIALLTVAGLAAAVELIHVVAK